jgi:glucosamine-phosphate N-acetyltransferase
VFRRLEAADYSKGFMDALSFLTQVGQVSEQDFNKRFNELYPAQNETYKILVIVDVEKDRVIGAGSLIIEKKFIR